MVSKKSPGSFEPIAIETHHELAGRMKEIVARLNQNPEIARRSLINPIFALEEIGVHLGNDMEKHVHDMLHEPPAKKRRLAELEAEIKPKVASLTGRPEIPSLPKDLAKFLFSTLKLTPLKEGHREAVEASALADYVGRHPLVAKLAEYETVRKSGLVFHRRSTYDAYKKGEMKQHWVNSVTFGKKA